MKSLARQLRNEEGSVIVVALMILVVLTIIGISATDTTTVELQIATNDKFHKIAFYNADAGVYAIAKVASQAVNEKSSPTLAPPLPLYYIEVDINGDYQESSTSNTFYRELAGHDPNDSDRDIRLILATYNIDVDVTRIKAVTVVGGGAEFASAADGAGVSSKGIYYDLDSFGSGPRNSLSNVGARYLKVVGAAGGL